MKKLELVLIPVPVIGHLVSTREFAKSLLGRSDHLSITILVIRPLDAPEIHAPAAFDTRIRFINIPPVELASSSTSPEKFASDYIESHKPHVEHVIMAEILSNDSVQLAGIVVGLFCTSMIDLAHQFKVPSYFFFTSGAAFLGFMRYLPIRDKKVRAEFGPSEDELVVSSYANPVPRKVLPSLAFDKDGYTAFLDHCTRLEETKGLIINTFAELEPHAINSMMMTTPPIYAVGPLLDLSVKENPERWNAIMSWLDDQPPSSVVFLCFGSRGGFNARQLEQIAIALERSGQRFLWSIRRPAPKESLEMPAEYQNIKDVLPEGFLVRTEKRGMVCGWTPQAEVLNHPATGGFVSHCGWNSILESLWYGVPVATWPLYAEQHMNAFELIQELGLAVDLKSDFRLGSGDVVMADVIERAINCLMEDNNHVRKMVKKMSEKSRQAVSDGGSSSASLGRLIDDLRKNIAAIDI